MDSSLTKRDQAQEEVGNYHQNGGGGGDDPTHDDDEYGLDSGVLRRTWLESKKLWYNIAGPAILTSVLQCSFAAITQTVAGHLGPIELVAVAIQNLAISCIGFGDMMENVRFKGPEDVALCKAVIAITVDGITGTNQGSVTFWKRIMQEFCKLFNGNPNEQTTKSLENRYGIIRKEVEHYVSILTQRLNEPKSGQSEADMIKDVREEYEAIYGCSFQFEQCFEVLKDLRKFDPTYCTGSRGNFEDEGSSHQTPPNQPTQRFTSFPIDLSSPTEEGQNNPTPRPPGTTAEKRARKSSISQASFDCACSKSAEFVELYKTSQQTMSNIGATSTKNMAAYIAYKEKHDAKEDEKKVKKEEKIDMLIMGMVTTSMPNNLRRYWESLQKQVCIKRGLPWDEDE